VAAPVDLPAPFGPAMIKSLGAAIAGKT